MRQATFHEPIWLCGDAGEQEILSADQAYEVLTQRWPETRGKWYHAATRACRSASAGQTSPHIARRMFMQAADESRLAAR